MATTVIAQAATNRPVVQRVARGLERDRLLGIAAAEHEQGRAGQAEEDEIDGDDVAEDLAEGAGQSDYRGRDALQDDRDDRHAGASR